MSIQTQKTLSPVEQLEALAWAANRSGKSYGIFTSRLTIEEKKSIYDEYIEWQNAKEDALAEWSRQRHLSEQKQEDDGDDDIVLTENEDYAMISGSDRTEI